MAILRDPSGHFYSDGNPLTEEEKAKMPSRFKKGQSYRNVSARSFHGEVKALLKEASPAAAKRLIELINSDNERIALQAATAILDRVFGKPTVAVQVEQNNDVSVETRALIRSLIIEREGEKGLRSIAANMKEKPSILHTRPKKVELPDMSKVPTPPPNMVTSRHKYDPSILKPAAKDVSDEIYDIERTRDCIKILPFGMRKRAESLEKPAELADVNGVVNIVSGE